MLNREMFGIEINKHTDYYSSIDMNLVEYDYNLNMEYYTNLHNNMITHQLQKSKILTNKYKLDNKNLDIYESSRLSEVNNELVHLPYNPFVNYSALQLCRCNHNNCPIKSHNNKIIRYNFNKPELKDSFRKINYENNMPLVIPPDIFKILSVLKTVGKIFPFDLVRTILGYMGCDDLTTIWIVDHNTIGKMFYFHESQKNRKELINIGLTNEENEIKTYNNCKLTNGYISNGHIIYDFMMNLPEKQIIENQMNCKFRQIVYFMPLENLRLREPATLKGTHEVIKYQTNLLIPKVESECLKYRYYTVSNFEFKLCWFYTLWNANYFSDFVDIRLNNGEYNDFCTKINKPCSDIDVFQKIKTKEINTNEAIKKILLDIFPTINVELELYKNQSVPFEKRKRISTNSFSYLVNHRPNLLTQLLISSNNGVKCIYI